MPTSGPLSLEHRQSISNSLKGRKRDPEVMARILAFPGRGEKISATLKGRKRPQEVVDRIQATKKAKQLASGIVLKKDLPKPPKPMRIIVVAIPPKAYKVKNKKPGRLFIISTYGGF
jgi:hypothetical protein